MTSRHVIVDRLTSSLQSSDADLLLPVPGFMTEGIGLLRVSLGMGIGQVETQEHHGAELARHRIEEGDPVGLGRHL